MTCINITARIIGDSEHIESQVTQISNFATQVSNDKDSVNTAKTDAIAAKDQAETAAKQAQDTLTAVQAVVPSISTSKNGLKLSDKTGGYNFVGAGVDVVKTVDDNFDVKIAKSGDMFASTYDPNSIQDDTFDRANHVGTQDISTVNNLQNSLDLKLNTNDFNSQAVKNLYEQNADTNAFTDAEKQKLDSTNSAADMQKSVYDPRNKNKDIFNPTSLDCSIYPENTVLSVQNGVLADSGVTAHDGSIQTNTNSVNIGSHHISSAGENVTFKNDDTMNVYTPVWQQVKRDSSPLPSYRMYIDSQMSNFNVNTVDTDTITNPVFNVTSIKNYRIWSVTLKPSKDLDNVYFSILFGDTVMFNEVMGNFRKDLQFTYNFDSNTTPFDVFKDEVFKIRIYHKTDLVELYGSANLGLPYITFEVREWEERIIGTGGGSGSNLEQQVLDNKNEIRAHATAINNNANQLAQHENQITVNANNIANCKSVADKAASDLASHLNSYPKEITSSINDLEKSITINLVSNSGVIDSTKINLAHWFGGGGTAFDMYYGFATTASLDETAVKSGETKSVHTVDKLELTLTRSDTDKKYIYVWAPTTARITGFNFSGFVSVWQNSALTVDRVDGKLYISPNKTAAASVTFEIEG